MSLFTLSRRDDHRLCSIIATGTSGTYVLFWTLGVVITTAIITNFEMRGTVVTLYSKKSELNGWLSPGITSVIGLQTI